MSFISLFKRNKSITLRQELWLAILVVIIIGFVSSVLISTYSAKHYFTSQLHLKNIDNANSLALMLSQLHKDPVELELLISATFDTGHYQRIELQNPQGETIIKRVFSGEFDTSAPDWFHHFYHLQVMPGIAQVSDGWQQFGTLYLESHSQYTEQALWESAVRLFFSFFIVAIIACIASAYFLRRILRPLDDVVEQANALGDKRFIKSKVPNTYEFARLVSSMNLLSTRFSRIINEDKRRLEEFRFKSQHDELTGLANREYFSATLEAQLQQSKEHAHGALFLFRIVNLDQISEGLSAQALQQHQALVADYSQINLAITHTCSYIEREDSRFTLLKRVDNLLKVAITQPQMQAQVNNNKQRNELFSDADSWREAIEHALDTNALDVLLYPVKSFSGKLLQNQISLSLLLNGELYRSGYYYQWAKRLQLLARLDWGLIKYLVSVFEQRDDLNQISVELSRETLLDDSAVAAILTYLVASPKLAEHICFDVRESIVVSEFALFKNFCIQAKSMGAKVALKRVGPAFNKIKKIHELGLEIIKIDSVYGHNISYSQDNQTFLRGICSVAHSIGIMVIAEGVKNPEDQKTLQSLGFDGFVSQPVDDEKQEQVTE